MKLYRLRVCILLCSLIFIMQPFAKPSLSSFNVTDQLTSLKRHYYCPIDDRDFSPIIYDCFSSLTGNQCHIDYTQFENKFSIFGNNHFVTLPPLPVLTPDKAYFEARRLQRLLSKNVPRARIYSNKQNMEWIRLAKKEVEKSGILLKRAQILVVVDRNPKVQALCFVLAFPQGTGQWMAFGGGHVSTGKKGRKLYYVTPTGVFMNTTERLGYRALGTKNKLGIRGNGTKGMRVWDFGWQWAEKGWLPNHVKGQIRLEMHATDPVYLEPRLGNSASEGCVRISAHMNRFIDHYGIIDVLYEQAAKQNKRFEAILSRNRQVTPIAGDLLVVVDSSEKIK